MKNFDNQSIMRKAHELRRTASLMFGNGILFSACLQIAWAIAKSDNAAAIMRSNIVAFQYKKVDETIRNAVGTLIPNMLPPIVGNGRRQNDDLQVYFDIEKNEFRCYRKENFIKILNVVNA